MSRYKSCDKDIDFVHSFVYRHTILKYQSVFELNLDLIEQKILVERQFA